MHPADAVRVTRGHPVVWRLRETPRTTCPECGTRLFAEVPPIAVRAVSALLLPQGAFRPEFHMQCQFALRPIRDDLPHFKGFPSRFGGSDDTVDW
jgi:hypothetical protein